MHLANVSPTPIVQAMLLVRMPVARIHAKIQVFVAKMHCARFEVVRPCASVPEMLKEIHIMSASLLNVPIIRTVIYRNLASIQSVLIRARCPIRVDRMQTATWKIISVCAHVIRVQPVIRCWDAFRYNTATATINAKQELFATTAFAVHCAHRIENASTDNCACKAFVNPRATVTPLAPTSNIVSITFAPRKFDAGVTMIAKQRRIVSKIRTVVQSVRILVMDEHYAVEMLNVMHEIIMGIVVAKLALLAIRKSVAERSNARVIRTVRMISFAIRICAKLRA